MIRIMKASAGAGKTYNLAKTYIRLLLENRDDRYAYRHILAVTFTNKATAEMKNRILKELHVLAKTPRESAYRESFVPSLAPDDLALSKMAGKVLSDILHDYSAFAVSTIDKFFQQTLKAFSREIGQFASYQVELDRDSLVSESVDRLLDSVTEEDRNLLDWLKVNVLEQIKNGGKYKMDADLTRIAKRLLSAERQEVMDRNGFHAGEVWSKEKIASTKEACRNLMETYERQVREKARQVLQVSTDAGVAPEEYSRGFLASLYPLAEDGTDFNPVPGGWFMRLAPDPEKWFTKASQKKLFPKVDGLLQGPMEDFLALLGEPYALYNTAGIIDGQLFGMGVASELSAMFRTLMKEKNVLCLDDSNTILKNIIDGSDAPFVYEKIGVRFEHFLLDEFQDTSRVQWENFKPLLKESEGNNHENLIVGDVKQSIYRWRGSDWKLFNEEVKQAFPGGKEENLPANYRSVGNVVKFNNGFFRYLSARLDELAGDRRISEIYRNAAQKVGKEDPQEGAVEVTFCPAEQELEQVVAAVHAAMDRGASAGDIAVLVRSNMNGERVAVALINDGLPVITDDSLRVKSSVIVRRLVALLSYVDNPVDKIAGYMVSSLDIVLPDNCHSLMDLAENLYRQLKAGASEEDKPLFEGEVLHVQSFMDALQDYVSLEGNDLRGFLKKWEEENPSISSPSGGDSIRVMTVHKSKGLDFPYVILPFVDKVTLFKAGSSWCRPQLKGTPLEKSADGVYDVNLSGKSADTLFAGEYEQERFMQLVDNLNVLYVAMTRASKGMHLIAATPKPSKSAPSSMGDFLSMYLDDGCPGRTEPMPDDAPEMLFAEADAAPVGSAQEGEIVHFTIGNPYVFALQCAEEGCDTGLSREVKPDVPVVSYPSYPLNPGEGEADTDVRERGRLKFSADAVDFFSEDGEAGVAASHRIKGIVYHDILANVVVPEDLDAAVDEALAAGTVTSGEADEIRKLLEDRIASVADRNWFPADPSMVRNEVSILDTDGSVSRPDRVVIDGGKVIIIDYKFGQHEKRYERQVKAYADLYRRMGCSDTETYLWYVLEGEIRNIS